MKNAIKLLVLILIIVSISSCASKKTLFKQGIVLMEGADLFYEVKSNNETYNFDLNINHFGEHISFDFDLGNKKGVIYMYETALENATDLHNYFENGYEELKEKTAVWVSKKLFKDLKAGKSVNIGLSIYKSDKEAYTLHRTETFSFGNKGNGVPYKIPVFVVTTSDHKKEIWIADDLNNRLIVKMDIGFKIKLVDYKPFK